MTERLEIATLLYHEVTDDPTASGFQRPGAAPYKLTRRAFAEHLAQIAAGPFAPKLVVDIDLTRPSRHLLLTFDDGGNSALYASEELARRGWKGHFFIVTSLIGTRTFLDVAEIRYIRRCGHVIGSHSHTHPSIFREQPIERMLDEWRVSCDAVAQILGEPCIMASVPGGDISPAVLRSADRAGLHYLFTSEPWLVPRWEGACWILGRFGAKVTTPLRQVRELAQFRGWIRARVVRHAKVLARRALPPLYRLYVRRRTRERQGAE